MGRRVRGRTSDMGKRECQRGGRAELDVHLDVCTLHSRRTQSSKQVEKMVAIASPAARAKQRGPRKQVQRSEQVVRS